MSKLESSSCLTVVGHDPEGRWAPYFPEINETIDYLYSNKLISFTSDTHPTTIDSAGNCKWQIVVEESSINEARYRAVARGLVLDDGFINYWDGDRLLHAVTVAPDELEEWTRIIQKYNFLIMGATAWAVKTHPRSESVWEGVKSWWLGKYLGFEGDIANRGCFGFSREFATFISTYQLAEDDETDSLFPMLALAYQKSLTENGLLQPNRGIGYKEYSRIASYEDWIFEGLTQEESARRKSSLPDFARRKSHVYAILKTADKIAKMYGLVFEGQPLVQTFAEIIGS